MYIDSNNLYYLIMRIESLDILKGIGIILVVVGHMIGNQLYIRPWIYCCAHWGPAWAWGTSSGPY